MHRHRHRHHHHQPYDVFSLEFDISENETWIGCAHRVDRDDIAFELINDQPLPDPSMETDEDTYFTLLVMKDIAMDETVPIYDRNSAFALFTWMNERDILMPSIMTTWPAKLLSHLLKTYPTSRECAGRLEDLFGNVDQLKGKLKWLIILVTRETARSTSFDEPWDL